MRNVLTANLKPHLSPARRCHLVRHILRSVYCEIDTNFPAQAVLLLSSRTHICQLMMMVRDGIRRWFKASVAIINSPSLLHWQERYPTVKPTD